MNLLACRTGDGIPPRTLWHCKDHPQNTKGTAILRLIKSRLIRCLSSSSTSCRRPRTNCGRREWGGLRNDFLCPNGYFYLLFTPFVLSCQYAWTYPFKVNGIIIGTHPIFLKASRKTQDKNRIRINGMCPVLPPSARPCQYP